MTILSSVETGKQPPFDRPAIAKGLMHPQRAPPPSDKPARGLLPGGFHFVSIPRNKGDYPMGKQAAFCLVENDKGQILMVQRGYGNKKGKWSLPGGFVDRGERPRRAAYRETKEETGIVVKITHRLFTGRTNPVTVYAGTPVGGRLQYQRRECLDVRWRDPSKLEEFDLAFGGDRKALRLWTDIKQGRATAEAYY